MKTYYSTINGNISLMVFDILFEQTAGYMENLNFQNIQFPAGEIQERCSEVEKDSTLWIVARFHSSQDIMRILLQKEAFISAGGKEVNLFLPYMPYSRQDREVFKGDPFALKVFADIIKSAGFNKVYTIDQHSNVTELVFGDNFKNFTPEKQILSYINQVKSKFTSKTVTILSPDAGAIKRTENIVKFLNNNCLDLDFEIGIALKKRDPKTGKIIGCKICDELSENVIIVDEILDGGYTFINLAQNLACRPNFFGLFVTHGIFSKGTELLEKEFDSIGICDTFYSREEYQEKFPTNKLTVI